MPTEFITNSSTETLNVSQSDPSEGPLKRGLARNLSREDWQGSGHTKNEQYLRAFEENDLSKFFRKYVVEEFVQRNLRRAGINTVADILALDETGFLVYISGENQTVQGRSLALYRRLQREKSRIVQHHSRASENRSYPPVLGGQQILDMGISNDVALSAVERNLRRSQLGVEAVDSALSERENPKNTAIDADQVLNNPKMDEKQTSLELPPIHLGQIFHRGRFNTKRKGEYQKLPFSEEGLRRHVLIAGSTGSGKTVAARYIVEQAAIAGIPSIVVDAQGDISSLVLQASIAEAPVLFEKACSLINPETRKEEEALRGSITKHLEALSIHPGPICRLYAERALPRIFTPGRPDLGLPLSLPPYLDILAAYSDESNDELRQHELEALLEDEIENLVRTILPKLKPEKHRGYVELLVQLFRHANKQNSNLDGRAGIERLHQLVQQAQDIASNLFKNYLSVRDQNELSKAIYSLQFNLEKKWLEGQPLDIAALCEPGENNRTPINIINVWELPSSDDKKRVLRQVIAAVYKYGVQNPKPSGPPSLLLYIDEIGSGYGLRSVGLPEQTTSYHVYRVLNRLVCQARKYGISVMLASQSITHFHPELRKQLGTKIIGKVDDGNEQSRVMKSIGEDISTGACDREFVELQLPQLGHPKLLYVGVRGEAHTYEQFKCCTLDEILRGRHIRRWRDEYQGEIERIIENARCLIQSERWDDALRRLDQIANESHFLTGLHAKVMTLRGRCLVRLDRVSEAERVFEQGDSDSSASDLVDFGRELASWYRGNGQQQQYVRILRRTAELAAPLDLKISEVIQLELSKYNLFEVGDPCAAEDNLKAISKSQDQKVTLFARTWQKAAALFRSWASAWPFVSSTWAGGEVSLVEPVTGQLAVAITVLPRNEDSAKEPIAYRSELEKNPEILRISRILDKTTKQRPSFSSLSELNSFQSDYQRRLGRAHEFRDTGSIREAITELEQLFKLPQIVAPDPQEIKRYDEDPEVRRVRVADWLNGLDWRAFEFEVAILFAQMGYNAWATGRTGDGGVDVRALRGNEKVVIQCKHWKRQNVGIEIVQAIHTTKEKENASLAVIVTSSNLEPVAHREARRCGVEVIEGRKLVELFAEYCDPTLLKGARNSLWQENTVARVGDEGGVASSDNDDDPDRKILKLVAEKRKVQNMDVQNLNGISRQAAGVRLRKLVERGYLDMHGTRAIAYYTIREGSRFDTIREEMRGAKSNNRGSKTSVT